MYTVGELPVYSNSYIVRIEVNNVIDIILFPMTTQTTLCQWVSLVYMGVSSPYGCL